MKSIAILLSINCLIITLGELDLGFLSNWMEWDRAEYFPFVSERNGFRFTAKQMEVSQRELSPFGLDVGTKLVT